MRILFFIGKGTGAMDGLTEARQTIERVDRELAALFAERMKAAEQVAAYKKENGLPIEDREREALLFSKEEEYVPEPYRPYYRKLLETLIGESKAYQRTLVGEGGKRLFCSGYEIRLERGALSKAGDLFDLDRKVLILTDDGVPSAYAAQVASACREPYLVTLPAGEANKCPGRWLELLRRMTEGKFRRSDCVVCVGGGVIGDLGGFAAASYMRGIDLYMVPTTLLSQIDSSVGGKVAVDFEGYKNLIGAFWRPRGVLIDPEVLKTLDARQFGCGMAEAIKMFALSDREMFERLEREGRSVPVETVIERAVRIKISVVERDEKEGGLRRCLNFGHTVGHGIEALSSKDRVPLLHGECVGLGMLCLTDGEVRDRIRRLLLEFGLPTEFRAGRTLLREAVAHDKKAGAQEITVVRVPEIGRFTFEKMTPEEILDHTAEVLKFL